MQRLHRQAGKLLKRSADEADVATVMQEFMIADQLLDSFMDAARSFQNGWNAILNHQLGVAQQLETLYRPIHDPESKYNAESDPAMLDKALQLKSTYADLEKDLQQETNWIQAKLLQPAMDAKQSIAPLKKTLKKRENYKLDYERYKTRVDSIKQKGVTTAKADANMARSESDLSQAEALYFGCDNQIKQSFPAVIDAIQSLIPLLMNTQIMLQHALVGQLYTVVNEYCQQFQFPSPAPPMEDVVSAWDQEFSGLRHEVESGLKMLSTGKAIHQPMRIEEKASTVTGLGIRGKVGGITNRKGSQNAVPQIRRTSTTSSHQEEDEETPPPRPPRIGGGSPSAIYSNTGRIPSQVSLRSQQSVQEEEEEAPPPKPPRPSGPGPIPLSSKPRTPSSASIARFQAGTPLPGMSASIPEGGHSNGGSRRSSTSAASAYLTPLATPSEGGRPGLSPQQDYFDNGRTPSTSSIASSIAAKKKKPPPPPVKRRTTANQDLIVTALYDFAGQGDGDLAFKEGDQIKVLKKSDSTDDWWLGSLRGQSGSFPANYVQMP
ncbi:HOB1-like protein [Elsinoe fawcettii]|nr:HOB1-like protein [Elsinoe fawcettii]